MLGIAGVAHFVAPDEFDAIVPHLLPGTDRVLDHRERDRRARLSPSGSCGHATRHGAATLAAVFFVIVFPANIQDGRGLRPRTPAPEFAVALLRLPLQIPLIWWAWHVRSRYEPTA